MNKRLIESEPFKDWIQSLKDAKTQSRINRRLWRLRRGDAGDSVYLDGNVSELRIHFGPGYRVYYTEVNNTLVVLLVGGDKSTQQSDIARAIEMAEDFHDDDEVQ